MLDSRGGLAIAILVFYTIGLPAAIYVIRKHGIGRHAGWIYLLSLPIVRIVGAACQIAAEQNPSVGLYTAAAICYGIGLVPLLFTLMSMVQRTNDGMSSFIPPNLFRLNHLVIIAGLILTIVGSVETIPGEPSDQISLGTTLRKVGTILLLVSFVAIAVGALCLMPSLSRAWHGDRRLYFAALVSLPFLLVRVIYSICVAFAPDSKTFYYLGPNIWVQAFMMVVMEFIVWGLYLAAGLASPNIKEAPHFRGRENAEKRGNQNAV